MIYFTSLSDGWHSHSNVGHWAMAYATPGGPVIAVFPLFAGTPLSPWAYTKTIYNRNLRRLTSLCSTLGINGNVRHLKNLDKRTLQLFVDGSRATSGEY